MKNEDMDDDPALPYKYFRILYPYTSPEAVMKRIFSKYSQQNTDNVERVISADTRVPPSE